MAFKSGKLEFGIGVLVSVFFAALFLQLTTPIFDPDFWWHLASGRWMWEHRSLMHQDPFGFVNFDFEPTTRRDFILKQYWLAQLLSYGVYLVGSYKGIILLRAGVFTAMFFLIYRLLRENNVGRLLSVAFVFVSAMIIVGELQYVGDRPQMWSSMFTAAAVYLLEAMRMGRRRGFYLLPIVMLLWSNMHGGYVLGDVVIAIYMFSALVFRFGGWRFQAVTALAVLLSFLNPNGFTAFLRVLTLVRAEGSADYWSSIVETQSIFRHASFSGIFRRMPYLSGLFAISVLSIALNIKRARSMRKELILLYVLALVMGYKAIRFLIFFVAFASLISAVNLTEVVERIKSFGPLKARDRQMSRVMMAVTAFLLIVFSSSIFSASLGTTALALEKPFARDYAGAADLIEESGFQGRAFSEYSYGGYLIWRLYPKVKLFIDGRGLSFTAFDLFKAAVDSPYAPASAYESTPIYRKLFDHFEIDAVIIPGCDKVSGVLIELAPALIRDQDWALVFADRNSLVFMRDSKKNGKLIRRYRLPEERAYENIIAMARAAGKGHGAMMPDWKYSMAVGYEGLDRPREAKRWLEQYLRFKPGDEDALMLKHRIARDMERD